MEIPQLGDKLSNPYNGSTLAHFEMMLIPLAWDNY
jgi:hypothetical protein